MINEEFKMKNQLKKKNTEKRKVTHCVVATVSPLSLILSFTALPPLLSTSFSFSRDLFLSLLFSFLRSSSYPSGPWSFFFLCFLCLRLCFFLGEVDDDSIKINKHKKALCNTFWSWYSCSFNLKVSAHIRVGREENTENTVWK